MRELTFQTFFEGFVPSIGKSVEEFPCGSVDGERHCAAINAAVRRAYEYDFFPETLVIEERTPDSDNVVAQAESGETEIDTVQGFFASEANARAFSCPLPAERIPSGWLLQDAADSVWVRFRPVAPKFTRVKWDVTKTYAVNDVRYLDTNGKCYKALLAGAGNYPETATTYWAEQPFPGFFEPFVQYAAAAANWKFEHQWSEAGSAGSDAKDELSRLRVVAKQQGGQL